MKTPEKQPEAIILELDDRLEFGAVIVDSGDPTDLRLIALQCHCPVSVNSLC
jgi:hypothetical protein